MGQLLSLDLRTGVVAAVSGGLPRRAAAERFGVSAATAVHWIYALTTTGSCCAKPQGGGTRSHKIGAFAGMILAAIEAQKDIALAELAAMLREDHGVSFVPSTIWRCLDRHRMTLKKKRCTQPSRNGQTSPLGEGLGSRLNLTSILSAWCSSTRPGLQPG